MSIDIIYLCRDTPAGEDYLACLNQRGETPQFHAFHSSIDAEKALASGKYQGLVVADYNLGKENCLGAVMDANELGIGTIFLSNGESPEQREIVTGLTKKILPKFGRGTIHNLLVESLNWFNTSNQGIANN